KSLREQMGLVTQETFLFHDTIFSNIQFGRLDATPEEVREAARAAYAHDFIVAQPKGYETVIGDKGCLLSGGQQQRLAIARAVLKNAPILLLDETTSSLDSESEKQIQKALEKLAAGRTVIAIARRLSTVLSADQIVVMDYGRIKEIGTHAELLDKSGYYRRLYDHQFNRPQRESAAEQGILVEELVKRFDASTCVWPFLAPGVHLRRTAQWLHPVQRFPFPLLQINLWKCRLISTCTPIRSFPGTVYPVRKT